MGMMELKRDSGQEWKNRILDSRTVDELDYDAKFSVFVSYIEICDHSIYDLLEDFDTGMIRTNAKSKVLVEDSLCNPYVHDINKVEVRSSDEVSQLLFHGQHKLTSGMDTHYKTSSHSIFTIYIVQALFDPFDSEILKDERAITVSQLSIVELGFCGMPSAFAAKNENFVSPENSNTPLSVLMKCFDAYRKSETQGGSKLIPYHENELTYLIKSYFDGKGKMKMIICMNEGYDYKKIMYLLQFATTKKKTKKSWSSSTLWSRSSSSWASKDEALFQKAISKLPDNKNLRHEQSSTNGLNWACPPSVIKSSSDDVVYLNLIGFLNEKMCHTKPLLQNLENQRANLKNNLVAIVQENEELKEATKALQMNLESKTELVIELEKKVSVIDNVKEELEKKISALRNQVDSIKLESPVVANVRHQKSHVGGGGLWIVHEPKKCLYSSNILKPNKKKTKSFCNLELKDILKSKASKYALQYQEQTFSGETETYLFKADITQTIGGGVQVIFNDIEIVKREPPPCMF
ncbi:kinesin-like protein KIF23 [Uloborus diversus]|uniref:kinesin-like protein KIF23 n=1 Tax=Uloborus diversus TaxID=327109 RepID=UPI002409917D|nr:kinesin-like protein KIF23 [Uloborus diversus]